MLHAEVDTGQVARWAAMYRAKGFNPLPMRSDAKRPQVRFAEYWDTPAPADLFERHPATSIQVMTGRRWRLLVLDLDGPEACDWLADRGPMPRTWATHSGGDGLHLWFRLPAGFRDPIPKTVLWKGEGTHSAVEVLCDRSLIVAPPSIHPTTGRRYRFRSKGESPARLPMPAPCPAWVFITIAENRRQAERDRRAAEEARRVTLPTPSPRSSPSPAIRYRAADVLEAIPDKVGLAASWGLRVASNRASKGWRSCHAIGREDRTPSAQVSEESGWYVDFATGESFGFFDLAARLGVYADWRDAVADLGERYHARETT